MNKKEILEKMMEMKSTYGEIHAIAPSPYIDGLLVGLDLAIILLKDEEDEQ